MKRCTKCSETKALSEFHKHKISKDGLSSWCKECDSIRCRAYRMANVDKVKARMAKYDQAKWRAENPNYQSRWQAENPNYQANWRIANADRLRAKHARWRAGNPEKMRAYRAKRRARKLGASGTATAGQIAARWKVYGDTCYICNGPAEATDHVIPFAAGGSNWPANLRPICGRCNSWKKDNWPYDFVAAKQRVYQGAQGG